MAQHYTPIWDDWIEVTQELNDQEKGRLIDAIVVYDNGGDWQERIKGNERYVFPGYRARLDRYKEANANKNRDKEDETEKSEISKKSKKSESDKKIKNSKIPKVYVYDKDIDSNSGNSGDARAREDDIFSFEVDPLIVKVQKELNGLTDTHYQALDDYRAELTDEVVSHAIDTAVANGSRNWAYVEAVLRSYTKEHVRNIGEAKAADENHRNLKTAVPVSRGGGGAKPVVNPWADAVQRGDYDE